MACQVAEQIPTLVSIHTIYAAGIDALETPRFTVSRSEPRLLQGSTIEQDKQQMLENGYVFRGMSAFNGPQVGESAAIKAAKEVYADTVIVYSQYRNTVSGSMPVTLPDTQTTYHYGSIYGSGGYASYFGSSTTYGTETTYIPYSVDRYDHLATFWAKGKPMRLGIYGRDLSPEERKKAETNKGVCITAVVMNSAAFDADLVPGDIVRKFNETEILDTENFRYTLERYQGRTIRLEVLRQEKLLVKEVKLSETGYSAGRVPLGKVSDEPVEPQTYTSAQQPEADPEPKASVDASPRVIRGYKLKRDPSGEIAKDKDANFIFIPVYEDEQKK